MVHVLTRICGSAVCRIYFKWSVYLTRFKLVGMLHNRMLSFEKAQTIKRFPTVPIVLELIELLYLEKNRNA